ncbi:MAG: GNAT family N-acetyltransferase [Ilumatobacter sp.]|uniref:GNAT family N-acetyltransferase n=1 Tax=Ilumatobacter sp. TaxID=1967498 RepID=UPI00262A1E66|nr:GNAT family N-acetyltransferase [Ilumatobacter sp.]MDJ0769898.1 GNAT family N-acetyltransferase [Ilumatobacter sp.]
MTDQLRTERLLLRRWTDADRPAFHALNSDPLVMATIGQTMSRGESDAFMNRIEHRFDEHGFGLWCVDLDGESIGFTGLMVPWFRDGVEIGWRIRSEHWGQGFAPEAALECLRHAFTARHAGGLGLDELVSFTAATNTKSRRVMEKIGLRHDPDGDFDHPSVPEGDPLRPHVLYRAHRATWAERGTGSDAPSEPAGPGVA